MNPVSEKIHEYMLALAEEAEYEIAKAFADGYDGIDVRVLGGRLPPEQEYVPWYEGEKPQHVVPHNTTRYSFNGLTYRELREYHK